MGRHQESDWLSSTLAQKLSGVLVRQKNYADNEEEDYINIYMTLVGEVKGNRGPEFFVLGAVVSVLYRRTLV